MSGSIHNVSGKALRDYVREHRPGLVVITRKVTNAHAVLYDRRTGQELAQYTSNFAMLDRLAKSGCPSARAGLGLTIDFAATQRATALKRIEAAFDLLLEAEEWLGHPIFIQDNKPGRVAVDAVTMKPITKADSYEP
jgi:hypothetical protein